MILLTLSALFLLWVKNPLHAVLGLILVFLNSANLLLSLNIHFIALIYVVVYVGAICVLFLFVIMLLNLRSTELTNRHSYTRDFIPYIAIYFIFLLNYIYTLSVQTQTTVMVQTVGNALTDLHLTNFITIFLFENITHFILLTILLFLAIIAPITIASKTITSSKKQDLFYAISRTTKTITIFKH